MKKRLMALLLTLAMVATFMPAMALTAFADGYGYPMPTTDYKTKIVLDESGYGYGVSPGNGYGWDGHEWEKKADNNTTPIGSLEPAVAPTPKDDDVLFDHWIFKFQDGSYFTDYADETFGDNHRGYFKPVFVKVYKIRLKDGNQEIGTIYRKENDANKYYSDAKCQTPLLEGKVTVPSDEDRTFEGFYYKSGSEWGCQGVKADGTVLPALTNCTLFAKWHDRELTSIEVTTDPDKTEYVAGEKFDAAGMEVTARYDNGKTKILSDDEYSVDKGQLFVGDEVTITYTEKEITKTCTYAVSVSAPVVIEGIDQKIIEGTKNDLTFKSNAPFDTFQKVLVDDKELKKDVDYVAKEGSTVITLKSEFVSALKVGVHGVKIESEGGTAEGTLTVVPVEKKNTGVATGDAENLMLWMMLAIAAMVAAGYAVSRKEN